MFVHLSPPMMRQNRAATQILLKGRQSRSSSHTACVHPIHATTYTLLMQPDPSVHPACDSYAAGAGSQLLHDSIL